MSTPNNNNNTSPRKPLILSDAFIVIPDESVYGPYPYNGLQIFGFAIITFFPALSLAVCGLRVYSRRLAKGFGLDDYLIFIAMVLALAQAVITAFVLKSGYWGLHDRQVPLSQMPGNIGAIWIFINAILYNPIFCLIKISALVFLLKLGGTKKSVRLACRAMIAFNTLQVLTFLPLTIVQCLPIESPWVTAPKDKLVSPKCIRRDAYALSQALVNILTDSLTLLIPFLLFVDLRVNKRVRMALMTVFLLGILVTIVSGVRLYYIIRLYYLTPADRRYSIGYVTSTVEINLAILTASVPALWPLARKWFPGVFSSLGIDRAYLEPDIEVAYATQQEQITSQSQSQSRSRKLTGKIMWQKKGRVPSWVVPKDNLNGPETGGGFPALQNPNTNTNPAIHVTRATNSSGGESNNSYSSSSSNRTLKANWLDDDDDDNDEVDISEMTYHQYQHHVRMTEAELRRTPSGEDVVGVRP